ncbi:MAG: hypothetical protein V1899_08050 [Planctomycetota bacterium]
MISQYADEDVRIHSFFQTVKIRCFRGSGRRFRSTSRRVGTAVLFESSGGQIDAGVFLLTKARAQALKSGMSSVASTTQAQVNLLPAETALSEVGEEQAGSLRYVPSEEQARCLRYQPKTYRIVGKISPEIWNRLGNKILPKLRAGTDMQVGIDISVTVESDVAKTFESDIRQILDDLGLAGKVHLE